MRCKECYNEIVGASQKRFCSDKCRMRFNRKNPNKNPNNIKEEPEQSNKSIFNKKSGSKNKEYYQNKLDSIILLNLTIVKLYMNKY